MTSYQLGYLTGQILLPAIVIAFCVNKARKNEMKKTTAGVVSLLAVLIVAGGALNSATTRRVRLMNEFKAGLLSTAKDAEANGMKLESVEISGDDSVVCRYVGNFLNPMPAEVLRKTKDSITTQKLPPWMNVKILFVTTDGKIAGEVTNR